MKGLSLFICQIYLDDLLHPVGSQLDRDANKEMVDIVLSF